jgi:hypothetical protein
MADVIGYRLSAIGYFHVSRWSVVGGRWSILLLALALVGCAPNSPTPPLPPTALPAPTIVPTVAPSAVPLRHFPQPGHALRGAFLAFWERHDGEHTLGSPRSDAVWLDGHTTQFFDRARLEASGLGRPATEVVSATLPARWRTALPDDLFDLAAAPWHATVSAPPRAEPLLPITVTLSIPGYSGPAELRIYDGRMQLAGAWPAELRDGIATLAVEGRGALGGHAALALIGRQVAGASSRLFTLDAQTTVQTGQPRFDTLYPQVRAFMSHDVTAYTLDGAMVRGYRSPDNDMLWLRDHTYQGRAFRYFERDMTSLIDAFRRAQRPDGSFPDYLARPEYGVVAGRMQVEADIEYLFVQAVYEAWQTTGDDTWLKQNLDTMRRAIHYTTSDPLRWDAERQLVKRPLTIDTWDFQYGPTTIDPTTGNPAPRHWIDDQTIWGIFHGDNTGLAYALQLLARVEERVGDPAAAAQDRAVADGIMERLNALSWNGNFFTHFVPLTSFDMPGVDEARQLSLSNAYALNRGVLRPEQGRAIIAEYYRRNQQRGGAAFAEWYSIDPPFPAGLFGLAGHLGERPGEYVNGGIMPLVGGELARGAFRYGAERYGFDILTRYAQQIGATGASYLWYYPAGNPGKSSADTLPTDGWGASAMLGALIEGAAGVEDQDALYRDVSLSPCWSATEDVSAAWVVARYAASNGYVAYRWRHAAGALTLDFTGSGERAHVRLLLPAGVEQVTEVALDGAPQAYQIEDVFGSRYVDLEIERGSGVVEVVW